MALNFLKKRDAFIIADHYGFFPHNNMRFEEERDLDTYSWGFFANKSNRTQIHIKFDSNLLDQKF